MDVTVSGARIFVKEWGTKGPVVLMLHGNPDTHAIWEGIATRLAEEYRCIAPDLPGMGRSEEPPGFDASLASQASFVNALLDALDVHEPIHLAVHDVGGPYGLSFVCEHPDRVRSLVIANTLFHASYEWHPWARVWRTPVLGEIAMRIMNRPLFIRELLKGSRKLSRATISRAYDQITPRGKRAVLKWYRAMTPSLFAYQEARLRDLTANRIPTTVVWGEHDPYIPLKFAHMLGTTDVRIFPDAGHWVIAEEPEAVSDHLRAFFSTSK